MKTQHSLFKIILLVAAITNAQAEKTSKTITAELDIKGTALVLINQSKRIDLSGNGRINSRNLEGQFVVSGRDATPHVFVINKDISINTWDKNTVKQSLTIELSSENNKEILEALTINLSKNILNEVVIDNAVNIDKFKIRNSFFGSDNNSIILNNGKEFKIDYLEITTLLTVPQNSHLKIISDHADVALQKHTGKVLLDMSFGEFNANSLNNLQATLDTTTVNIDNVKNADFHLQNSLLNTVTSEVFDLTSSLSRINIDHVDELLVKNSLNDNLTINSINKLVVNDSLFSNQQIERINQSLEFNGKNTDISVAEFSKNTTLISMTNSNADMKLALNNLDDYQLNLPNPRLSQFIGLKNLELQTADNKLEVYQKGRQQLSQIPLEINLECKYCSITLD